MSFKATPLGDFVEVNPEGRTRAYPHNEILYIDISSVGSGHFVEMPKMLFLNDAPSRAKRILRDGDTILATVRPNLRSFLFIRDPEANTIASTGFAVLRAKKNADPRFIYYAVTDRRFTGYLTNNTKGTSYPAVDTDTILRGEISYFNLQQQQSIASILSAYDDLIENNRRRIKLLEQAARLLYKEWFVHLRFPGHEHVKIIDGVPEGWEEGVVADFYSTGSGGTPSRKRPEFYTGEIPWVKTQELIGGFILFTDEQITDEAINLSSAKPFPRHTVLIAMYGATIGQTAILSIPSTTNQACCAVVPKKPGASYSHAYLFFCHHKTDLVGLGKGAAQNNISQQIIKSFKMVLPGKELLHAFASSVSPIFDQIEILQKSKINLSKARELLLPRLMNGEIPI
jgi:type I restriction enzyme S subunit